MSNIWLADLARAVTAVDPTPAERAEIMHMLAGNRPAPAPNRQREAAIAWAPSTTASNAPVAPPGDPAETPITPEPAAPPESEHRPDEPAALPDRAGAALLSAFRRRLDRQRRPRFRSGGAGPDLLTAAGRQMSDPFPQDGASLPRTDRTAPSPSPKVAPLLATRSTRAIIWHLLAQRVDDGPVDTAAAVTMLARREPPRSIPRLPRRTLRFGVRLLVDRSESMRLFGQDQRQLIRAVRQVLGPAITDVQYFVGSPLRGITDRPAGRPRRYVASTPGTPVLLLTDFGSRPHLNCAPGAPRSEWEAFLGRCTTVQQRPAALVPFRAEQAPDWVGRWCRVVTWDRTTTANAVGTGSR